MGRENLSMSSVDSVIPGAPGQALSESEIVASMVESCGVAVFRTDIEGHINYANGPTANLFKYALNELKQMTYFDLLPLHSRERARERFRQLVAGRTSDLIQRERTCRRADNSKFWAGVNLRLIRGANSVPVGVVCMVVDFTARKSSDDALRLTTKALHAITNGVCILDPEKRIFDVNPAFKKITGYPRGELVGRHLKSFATDQQDESFYLGICRQLDLADGWEGELQHRRKNGESYRIALSISAVRDERNRLVGFVGAFQDITQRHWEEGRIRQLAYHDPVTQLANRVGFVRRAAEAMEAASNHGHRMACLFIDLDRFKAINDTLGHEAGDHVLREVAARLRSKVRASDLISRFGGDEFVILLPEVTAIEALAPLAEKIAHGLAAPWAFEGNDLAISGSIGIAVFPDHGNDIEELIRRADQAMYTAKARGGAVRICFAEDVARQSMAAGDEAADGDATG
jgi:diguanylate cyclase (GGDEF)-like protein/PAS domain S-box-containing protein